MSYQARKRHKEGMHATKWKRQYEKSTYSMIPTTRPFGKGKSTETVKRL